MRFLDLANQLQGDAKWAKLHISARFLYVTMAQSASKEDWFGFGVTALSRIAGMRTNHIYGYLKILTDEGYIKKDPRKKGAYHLLRTTSEVPPQEYHSGRTTPEVAKEYELGPTETTSEVVKEYGLGPHSPSTIGSPEVRGSADAHTDTREDSGEDLFGDVPADIPDDDPYGLFSSDSVTRTPAREPLSNGDLDDLVVDARGGLSRGFRLCLLV